VASLHSRIIDLQQDVKAATRRANSAEATVATLRKQLSSALTAVDIDKTATVARDASEELAVKLRDDISSTRDAAAICNAEATQAARASKQMSLELIKWDIARKEYEAKLSAMDEKLQRSTARFEFSQKALNSATTSLKDAAAASEDWTTQLDTVIKENQQLLVQLQVTEAASFLARQLQAEAEAKAEAEAEAAVAEATAAAEAAVEAEAAQAEAESRLQAQIDALAETTTAAVAMASQAEASEQRVVELEGSIAEHKSRRHEAITFATSKAIAKSVEEIKEMSAALKQHRWALGTRSKSEHSLLPEVEGETTDQMSRRLKANRSRIRYWCNQVDRMCQKVLRLSPELLAEVKASLTPTPTGEPATQAAAR
jgi:SWI/SNF-related matrix-associated actin-dependent regulator 1 of chromatin subfamily A